jgi:hypothetical protein
MARNPSESESNFETYFKFLMLAFKAGADMKRVLPAAEAFPKNKYRQNIQNLANHWPDRDSIDGLVCAYKTGEIAARKAGPKQDIDEAIMERACLEMEKNVERLKIRGPVCRKPTGSS